MNRCILFFCMCAWQLASCAGDDCVDGKCSAVDDSGDRGTSAVLALDPSTGDFRWLIAFEGETVDIRGTQDNSKSVVFALSDPCFSEDREFAFTVEDGYPADVKGSIIKVEEVPFCDAIAVDGVETWKYVSGHCVGRDSQTDELVAVDVADSTEVWRESFGVGNHYVFGNVLLALVEIVLEEAVQYRLIRIAVANGGTTWIHQQEAEMVPLGANSEYVFILDTRPFALNAATGDLGWEHIEDGWQFVSSHDGGILLDDTLYVKRQYFLNSKCAQ